MRAHFIAGIALIITAVMMIVFRGRLARANVAGQNEVWRVDLGSRAVRLTEAAVVAVALGFAAGGVYSLLH